VALITTYFLGTAQQHAYTSKLAHLAQDLICVPASQSYVERVFSLCGILTAGRRSSMRKSLEMRIFLKLKLQQKLIEKRK